MENGWIMMGKNVDENLIQGMDGGWKMINWWHIDDESLDYHGEWNLETRWSNRVQVQYSRFKAHMVATFILLDCQWETSWLPSWIDIVSSSKSYSYMTCF
jgi:hypothetical protein